MRIFIAALATSLGMSLSACGGGDAGGASTTPSASQSAMVNLVVSDTPASNITVLSFQVQITGAVLQPGNVSILPRPVTVDLAQLVSDTGFLASTVIDSATYSSLQLSFANPQVTLMNTSNASITLGNQTCAAGATCTYAPAINSASVTISNGVFPLTVTASSSTGLNLDLSIPDLLQSDLSIAFANGSSVNLSLLSANNAAGQQADIDDVIGTVTAVSAGKVNLTTAFGDSLVLTGSTATAYAFPAALCAANNASCVQTGQIVSVDLGLIGDGGLSLKSLSYLAPTGSPLIKALVLSANPNGATPMAQVLVQRAVNVPTVIPGQVATVSLTNSSFSVGGPASPSIAGANFTGAEGLLPGQELVVAVGADLLAGTTISFSTDQVILQPSQAIGEVTAVNAMDNSVTIDGLSALFTGYRPAIQLIDIQTDANTDFAGFSPADISAVMASQFVVAKGPLYATSSGTPAIGAIALRKRLTGN